MGVGVEVVVMVEDQQLVRVGWLVALREPRLVCMYPVRNA